MCNSKEVVLCAWLEFLIFYPSSILFPSATHLEMSLIWWSRDQKKRRLWRRECSPIGFWILTIFFILTTWLLDNVPLLYEESRRRSVLEVYGLMLIDHTKTIDDWERIYKAIFTRKSLSCYTNYHDWIMLTSNCKYPTIWQIINSY